MKRFFTPYLLLLILLSGVFAPPHIYAQGNADFLSFSLSGQSRPTYIDDFYREIHIEVYRGTDVTALAAEFTLSSGASAYVGDVLQVSGETVNDFSSPLDYTIVSADSASQKNWTVYVWFGAPANAEILAYSIPGQTEPAVIDNLEKTVEVSAPGGADVTNLTASFSLSDGATAYVGDVLQESGVTPNDFSSPVVYAVHSEDGTHTVNWTVTVSKGPSNQTDFLTFTFPEAVSAAEIDAAAHTISIEAAYDADFTSLVAEFTLSEGAAAYVNAVEQVSGVTANDFSGPVIYAVVAEDGETVQQWTVAVERQASPETEILVYTLPGQTESALIDSDLATVYVEVEYGTPLSNLAASFTLSNGARATVKGTPQVSGQSRNDFTTPVTYLVTAENGIDTKEWTVYVDVAPSHFANFESYGIPQQTRQPVINAAAASVSVVVENGTDLGALTATFTLSEGATAEVQGIPQTSGVTVNDFKSPVVYSITAADGETTRLWTVTVTHAPSSATRILSFGLTQQTKPAIINGVSQSILVEVANGTDRSNLVASFILSDGATAEVAGIPQVSGSTANDFTEPVIYTITAEDGVTSQEWTVTVDEALSTSARFLSFTFPQQTGPAVINAAENEITIEVNNGTQLNGLVAEFTLSEGASAEVGGIPQTSGVTANDFSDPVDYTVTAMDGITQRVWTVSVIEASSSDANFFSYSFPQQTKPSVINGADTTITVEVQRGTDLTNLVAAYSLSEGATAKIAGIPQTSGVTANDFSSDVLYEVTALDGITKKFWTVTVSQAKSSDAKILSFGFPQQTQFAVIDGIDRTIDIEVANGTDLSRLTASFTLSQGARAEVAGIPQTSGKSVNSFVNPVAYTVFAEDDTTNREWVVTVTEAPSSDARFLSFSLPVQTAPAVIDGASRSISIIVAEGTNLLSLVPAFTLSEGATAAINGTMQISGESVVDFSEPVEYLVTAEDGVTSAFWEVTVTLEASKQAAFTGFSIPQQTSPAQIQQNFQRILITLAAGTDITGLTPSFTLSPGAKAYINGLLQTSGESEVDFSETVRYRVIAEDGVTSRYWSIIVTVEQYTGTDFLSFSFSQQYGEAVINTSSNTVTAQTVNGADRASITTEFTLSPGASAFVNDEQQVSGESVLNFTEPVVYKVIAEDGATEANWTVTITEGPSTEAELLSFGLVEQSAPATIDQQEQTITIPIGYKPDITALTAEFTISEGAVMLVNGEEQISGVTTLDFSSPVVYTIVAEDGVTTADWTVTVNQAPTPTISVTRPGGSEYWRSGLEQWIRWESSHLSRVDILYSTNFGEDWISAAAGVNSAPGTAGYLWTVPQANSDSCMVRVVNADDPDIYADCDGMFSIFSYTGRITVQAEYQFGDPTLTENYRMIGVPGEPMIALQEILSGVPGENWKAYRTTDGVELQQTTNYTFSPGEAVWIISENPIAINDSVPAVSIDDEAYVSLPVHSGWNLVANPFEVEVYWADVFGHGGRTLWAFDGAYYSSQTLQPYEGFCFYNAGEATELVVPYPVNGRRRSAAPRKTRPVLKEMQIALMHKDVERSKVIVGFDEEASELIDEFDEFAPPGNFERLRITITNNELPTDYRSLFSDYRPDVGEGQVYDLCVQSGLKEPFEIVSTGVETISNALVYLYDSKLQRFYDLESEQRITIDPVHSDRAYQLLIGTPEFIDEMKSAVKTPEEFQVFQNYPNPFNPFTVIRFSLPEAAEVTLDVFNAAGERVAVLYDGTQLVQGYHETGFDGTNLSTGVYFYRIQTGQKSAIRKMLLIK